ncbi:MAG: hypothetical protein JST80_03880 [Bdellovibrionales bacterium]|nr:hypothetical protein [Bdellovibrionales bacterium]
MKNTFALALIAGLVVTAANNSFAGDKKEAESCKGEHGCKGKKKKAAAEHKAKAEEHKAAAEEHKADAAGAGAATGETTNH